MFRFLMDVSDWIICKQDTDLSLDKYKMYSVNVYNVISVICVVFKNIDMWNDVEFNDIFIKGFFKPANTMID